MKTLAVVMAMIMAVGAGAWADTILVQENFESYTPGVWNLSLFGEAYFTDMGVVEDVGVAHGGSKFYRFYRESNLGAGASGYIRCGLTSPDGQPHIYAYTNYVRIGSTTLGGSTQVSSQLGLYVADGASALGGYFGLVTAAGNTNRRIFHYQAEGAGNVLVEEQIDFPVDTWLKMTLFVNTINNTWGYEVAETDGDVLKVVSDLAYLPEYGGKFFNPAGPFTVRTSPQTTAGGQNDGQNNLVDDVTLAVVPEPALQGTVILRDYLGDPADVSVRIELRENGVPVQVSRVNLDANGGFTLPNVTPGVYDVAVKSYAHLQVIQTGVNVAYDSMLLAPMFLFPGDNNNDNAVTVIDLSSILNNMDQEGE